MPADKAPSPGALQDLVDDLYREGTSVRRLDVVLLAESHDLPLDLQEVIGLLPPGTYTRQRLCDQINSSVSGHGWGYTYGTVE